MAEPFIGEIRTFPYTFVPQGWAACNGQLINISENTALFSIIGTRYGGNGRIDFALPDLQGRAPLGPKRGNSLDDYQLGVKFGYPSISLQPRHIPAHNHTIKKVHTDKAEEKVASNNFLGKMKKNYFYNKKVNITNIQAMDIAALSYAGNSVAHENRQPYLAIQFCIALEGMYPSRN